MLVSQLRMEPLPGGFRASAQIESEGGPCGELWFEATGGVAPPPPGMAAGAFLAACLSTAAWREDDLSIASPVDAELLWRARRQAQAFARLHRRARIVEIAAASVASPPRPGRLLGASFSGGVDSFHALMSLIGEERPRRIGALVTGLGFDTHPEDVVAHAELLGRLGAVSSELGLRHFAVRTNFRPFFRPYADWNRVTHGSVLVAFAFLLSGELDAYVVPGSLAIDRLYRWGTHSLLDGGWESGHLRVIVDGWHIRRNDKLVEVAEWPLALRHLRVCARGRGVENCGRCEKCLRTMALLVLAGKEVVPAFPHPLTADLIRKLKIREVRALYGWEGIRQSARRDPRRAWLADATGHLVRVTRFHAPRRRFVAWLRSRRRGLDPLEL